MIIETNYVKNLASKGARIDNRKPDEHRKIEIEYNYVPKAEGSARVTLGDTIVIAGVKIGIGHPFSDRPDQGVLMVNAELSPISSPDFETGPPSEGAIELSRVVDRGIRESKCIDLTKLCLEEGEKVLMVNIDVHFINSAGNLLDAAGIAALAALRDTKMPEIKDGVINYEKKTSKKLPVDSSKAIPVTFGKIGDLMVVDPRLEEEEVMTARFTVTTKDDGNVVALQKGGSDALSFDEIEKAFDIAVKRAKEIRKQIK